MTNNMEKNNNYSIKADKVDKKNITKGWKGHIKQQTKL